MDALLTVIGILVVLAVVAAIVFEVRARNKPKDDPFDRS